MSLASFWKRNRKAFSHAAKATPRQRLLFYHVEGDTLEMLASKLFISRHDIGNVASTDNTLRIRMNVRLQEWLEQAQQTRGLDDPRYERIVDVTGVRMHENGVETWDAYVKRLLRMLRDKMDELGMWYVGCKR